MHILLEEGMVIKHSDEALLVDNDDDYVWDLVGMVAGEKYRSTHVVMRREIKTINDLVEAYNKKRKD